MQPTIDIALRVVRHELKYKKGEHIELDGLEIKLDSRKRLMIIPKDMERSNIYHIYQIRSTKKRKWLRRFYEILIYYIK